MNTLTLRGHLQTGFTLLENDFIDNYMARANGEYVKVYLFLLRHLNNPYISLSISSIADCLENTEKDIVRALKYWEKEGLITLGCNDDGEIESLGFGQLPEDSVSDGSEPEETDLQEPDLEETVLDDVPSVPETAAEISGVSAEMNGASPEAANVSPSSIEQFRSRKELKNLLFITEKYMGKTLTVSDIEAITYFYDNLHFSADLVEYLIEYCVENGHKSMHYIRKVAVAWSEENIQTVDQAKEHSSFYNRNCYSILNAFGIKGRAPAAPELVYIRKWTGEYGFTLDIVLEACNRTMAKLHQPNFEYADSILRKWIASNIHHLADLERLDAAHRQSSTSRKNNSKVITKNKFNNFEGRTYDYDSLEKQLLSQ